MYLYFAGLWFTWRRACGDVCFNECKELCMCVSMNITNSIRTLVTLQLHCLKYGLVSHRYTYKHLNVYIV